jgi:hypothetical protein
VFLDQPGLGVEVGRVGGFADDRGGLKRSDRSFDASGAAEGFGQVGLQAAEVEPAICVGEAAGVVGDDLDEGSLRPATSR